MDVVELLRSLESSGLVAWLRNSLYAFPLIESFHVIGLTMVFGTIAVIDLRLLGIASARRPFVTLASDVLRWTWAAFAVTAATGVLMFITNPVAYYENVAFRFKMAALVLSGVNVLVFNMTARRSVARWNNDKAAPVSGRVAATVSIAIWIGVIFLGRWVGFTKSTDVTPDIDILESLDRF
jgi:hypothetical protein